MTTGCTGLTSIAIPNRVTNIGDYAFAFCTSLKRVYFEGDSPSVGSYAFLGNNNSIFYLESTTGWGPTFAGYLAVLWNPQVPYTFTTDNAAITITEYIGSDGAVTIPNSINGLPVTSVGGGAFASCGTLTNVTISNGITSIEDQAFQSCSSAWF